MRPGLGLDSLLDPLHCRMGGVFHLDPVRRGAGAVGAIAVLRHQALEAELAGLAKQVRADLTLFEGRYEYPVRSAR
jgi:hypothetical protein